MTPAEQRFWSLVRRDALGVKFRRQHPVDHFIADFAVPSMKLMVELDGGQHLESEHDRQRDARLTSLGWKVLRFWNPEVFENPVGLLETLEAELQARRVELGRPGE